MRHALFADSFLVALVAILFFGVGFISGGLFMKSLASREKYRVDNSDHLNQRGTESAPSQNKNPERNLPVLSIELGDRVLKLCDSSGHLEMIDGECSNNGSCFGVLVVGIDAPENLEKSPPIFFGAIKDFAVFESGIQSIKVNLVSGASHDFLANV
jgi:hypothetical protein